MALFLAAILCAALFSGLPPSPAMAQTARVNIALICPEDLQLYPLLSLDRDAQSLMGLVYESLVDLDDNRNPQPLLAESWAQVGGSNQWQFVLREGVYFHDGRALTANDVAATLGAIKTLADQGLGLYREIMTYIAGWEVENERTIRIRGNNASYLLLYAMTFPILPERAVNSECPPGTGAYYIEFFQAGKQVLLSGNQNWWKRPPSIQSITGIFYSSAADALNGFQMEEVDAMMTRSLSATRYRGVVGSSVNSYDYHTQQLECILINQGVVKLRDAELRKAIARAIDKSRLINGVYQSVATTTQTITMPGTALYATELFNSNEFNHDHNLAIAGRLLDDLGYNNYTPEGYRYRIRNDAEDVLTLRLYYYDEAGDTLRKNAAAEIRDMLAQVGIQVRTSLMTLQDIQAKMNSGDYDLILAAYNFGQIPDPSFLLANDGVQNKFRYNSKVMNTSLAALRSAATQADFQDAWNQVQVQFAEDLPLIPLYWRSGLLLMRGIYLSERDIREYDLLRGLPEYMY